MPLAESRRNFLIALPGLVLASTASAANQREFAGSYSDAQLVAVKRLTLPRVHLYDKRGRLIERAKWPAALDTVKKNAGEAFCCVSDKPAPPGHVGPPPDCKIIVYGADVSEHFDGLRTTAGTPIRYQDLPPHKYLIVDYFADWCAPCIPARRALEAFLVTPAGTDYIVLVVDFSRLPKAREAAGKPAV